MIRHATTDDIPALIECGREFFAEAAVLGASNVQFSEARLAATLADLIGKDGAIVLVAEYDGVVVGGLAAVAFPYYFAEDLTAQELFWWIDPARRGGLTGIKMLHMVESWARDIGCATLTMVAIAIPDSPASKIYIRQGFKVLEAHFVKEL